MPEVKTIPSGKVLLAEYKDVNSENRALTTVIRTGKGDYGRKYKLGFSTPGYECAGSVARWTNGYWFARCIHPDGTITGQRTNTEEEATVLFDKWTNKE